MQLQLAIFPERTKLINSCIGFYAKDDFVYYLHNGSPIFCHSKEDRSSYRYILANLVVINMCTCSEISKALGIHVKNIQRYTKDLWEKGMSFSFYREDNLGQCHKFTSAIQSEAQRLLDEGYSRQSENASTPHERNVADYLASGLIGMGVTRVDLRIEAAITGNAVHPVQFEPCQSVEYGGVLFLFGVCTCHILLTQLERKRM